MIINTTKMSSRGQVVIPLDLRKGIKEGDRLVLIREGDEIIMKKTINDLALVAEDSFAETWLNETEDEAWKDL